MRRSNVPTVSRRRWQAVTITGLMLAVAVLLPALAGFVAARDGQGFDTELAAIVGTAAGTTLLAIATWWLASSTRSDVRATQELAQLSRTDLEARLRPFLVDVPRGRFPTVESFRYSDFGFSASGPEEDRTARISDAGQIDVRANKPEWPATFIAIPVRNVGAGAALITDVPILQTRNSDGLDVCVEGTVTSQIVPSGDVVRALFQLPAFPIYSLRLDIAYADVNLQQRQRAEIHIGTNGQGDCVPLGVTTHREGHEPFVSGLPYRV